MKHVITSVLTFLAVLLTTHTVLGDSSGSYGSRKKGFYEVKATLKPTLGVISLRIKSGGNTTTGDAAPDPNGDGLDVLDSEEMWLCDPNTGECVQLRFKNGNLQVKPDGGTWSNVPKRPAMGITPSSGSQPATSGGSDDVETLPGPGPGFGVY